MYLNVVLPFKRTAEWTRATQYRWWIDLPTIVWNYRGILYIIVLTVNDIYVLPYALCLLLPHSLPYVEYHKLDLSKKKVLSKARLSAPLHKVNNGAWSDYLFFSILDVGPCYYLSVRILFQFLYRAYVLQAICYFTGYINLCTILFLYMQFALQEYIIFVLWNDCIENYR